MLTYFTRDLIILSKVQTFKKMYLEKLKDTTITNLLIQEDIIMAGHLSTNLSEADNQQKELYKRLL